MKIAPLFLVLVLLLSCSNTEEKTHTEQLIQIEGTWKLISSTTIKNDSSHSDDLSGREVIKIINATHFSFLNHDLNNGKDSSAYFVAGGGRYLLEDNIYTEFLDYCNYREWENNTFEFKVEIWGDTLIQSGVEQVEELGIDHKLIETYLKVTSHK